MDINDLTLRQINEIKELSTIKRSDNVKEQHPMLNRKCMLRTYSAGVHFGVVSWIDPETSMEAKLTEAYRLWSWESGGLSLSAIANKGIKSGRIDKTGEVFLTNVIEYIPYSTNFEKSFGEFVED